MIDSTLKETPICHLFIYKFYVFSLKKKNQITAYWTI